MKYPLMDPKFSLFREKLSEITLVSLGEISDTLALNSENSGSTSGISAKFHSSTLVSVGFTLSNHSESQIPLMHVKVSGHIPIYNLNFFSFVCN